MVIVWTLKVTITAITKNLPPFQSLKIVIGISKFTCLQSVKNVCQDGSETP